MKNYNNLWDISNRPSTKTKLEILEKVFDVWLTIWNKQNWVQNEWYIVDLFAGKGEYIDNGNKRDGSPLIFLNKIAGKKDSLRNNLKFKIFLVEKNKKTFNHLKKVVNKYISENSIKNVEICFFNEDCNQVISQIINSINNTSRHPLFILVDPTGLQIKKATMQEIVKLQNPKDILFNYILEGVIRTSGVARKKHRGEVLNMKELKTVKTLKEFIGDDVDVINADHRKILEDYVEVFTSLNLNVVGYDMKYPDRNNILYYLLFASKKITITNIIKDVYSSQKKKEEEKKGLTLFGGKERYINSLFTINPTPPNIIEIKRKSLLHPTKVEYGDWTINHIIGCKHGCRFPCYAMMMAKRFGWVKNYEDWRTPRIVTNALELLEKEIPKYKSDIDFVHLCFMSDPFMYDSDKKQLVPEVKELTLKIIERLNEEGIKVTTLTKGIYPVEVLNKDKFLQDNEYGITLISLNNNFKEKFEPFSASYEERINSLETLAKAGLNTWVSMEPYPTPELDDTAENIENILERLSFVKKIIFGKLNYNRLANYDKNSSSEWRNNKEFYEEMAKRVINFCRKHNIKYHIKAGTPYSEFNTRNIFHQ
jgi:three-Cys-motif partner protein